MGENVEFWLTFRSMSYYSNYNRSIFIHTLFEGCVNCLFQGQPYLSRCELRLTIAHIPCKWRQVFLYVSFSPCGAGTILWLIYLYTHLKYWSYYSTCSDGNGISRVRAPVRANIILGATVITGMAGVHLLFLHQTGRNNPLGLNGNYDKIPFHRFLTSKDLFGFFMLFIIMSVICFFYP